MPSAEFSIKERGEDCKMFECPRFLDLCQTEEDGRPFFNEGDEAYSTAVLCSNQILMQIGAGDCIMPVGSQEGDK